MPIGLDLSSSEAKVDRACEHLEALNREIHNTFEKDGPYSVRFSQINPQTGWCDVYLVPNPKKPRLGIIVGDVMHNLRGALDYIVTELAGASCADPNKKRGFPVFTKRAEYRGSVANKSGAIADGPLDGIVHGLALIELLQPYRAKSDLRNDPLYVVNRFSNADKHREVADTFTLPVGTMDLRFNGTAVDKQVVREFPRDWTPDKETLIERIRFDPPSQPICV